ncbi:MAG: TIGR00730 family Rossman fold protein [Thermoanaerobaculia bacterium]
MNWVCVYCGSSAGNQPGYAQAAAGFGRLLGEHGLGLVYGGGNVGLMGILADAALAAGSEVVGVIPEHLRAREVAHLGLSRLHVVSSMHERKALMAELADCFLALPGGLGTLDELFEILTWAQLGLHSKPCGLLEVNGYFAPLLGFLDQAVAAGFVRSEHRALLEVSSDPASLLAALARRFQVARTTVELSRL